MSKRREGPPELSPEDAAHDWASLFASAEKPPVVKPYGYGEVIDPNDKTKSEELCPECEKPTRFSKRTIRDDFRLQFTCRSNHVWWLNTKDEKKQFIERPDPTLFE